MSQFGSPFTTLRARFSPLNIDFGTFRCFIRVKRPINRAEPSLASNLHPPQVSALLKATSIKNDVFAIDATVSNAPFQEIRTMKKSSTQNSGLFNILARFSAAAAACGLLVAPAIAEAQNLNLRGAVQGAVQGATQGNSGQPLQGTPIQSGIQGNTGLQGNLNQGIPVQGGIVQDPTQRGFNRAVQGVLQGGTAGQAIREGLNEGVQSAVETPQQTWQRDQFQNGVQLQSGQQVQGSTTGQVWQRDSQGRMFYTNNQGQLVYSNQTQPMQSNQGIQTQGNTGFNSNLGANFQPHQNGLLVSSLQAGAALAGFGVQPNDVLVNFNGQPINSTQALNHHWMNLPANQNGQLTVLRNGGYQTLNVRNNHQTQTSAGSANQSEPNEACNSKFEKMQTEIDSLREEIRTLRTELKSGAAADVGAEAGAQSETGTDR